MTSSSASDLFRSMLLVRRVEEALGRLWDEGLVSGEYHSGVGEEGVVVGVLAHLREGDAVIADHRSTPPFVVRGTDLRALFLEVLGHPEGLCHGRGGHMHLLDPERLSASSGIVGASGPVGCGFALAAQQAAQGAVAVAFFGEGAVNQGMLMESFNLAVAWNLPLVFVCKDDGWSITTRSSAVTGDGLARRAAGFGLHTVAADGRRVEHVHRVARKAVQRARRGGGPTFVHARVQHPTGHFLGFQLRAIARSPVRELRPILGPLLRSATSDGASLRERAAGVAGVTKAVASAGWSWGVPHADPVAHARGRVDEELARRIEAEVESLVEAVVADARATVEAQR